MCHFNFGGKLMLLLTLALMQTSQATVGPLDGFRANYAAIKADVDFEFKSGTIHPEAVSGGKLWSSPELGFRESEGRTVIGNWGCDGTAEYYLCGSPDAIIAADLKIKRKATDFVNHIPKYEMIYNGNTVAYHNLRTSTLEVQATDRPGLLGPGNGPFIWWGMHPFPQMLEAYLPVKTTTRRTSTRGGHFVEVETHASQNASGWQRIEVSYDPSVGYLPRYMRMIVHYDEGNMAYVKEFYLISTAMSSGGGFIPTDWYQTFFEVDRFEQRYPSHDEETIIDPIGNFGRGHCAVTQINKTVRPIQLRDVAKIRRLSAIGGRVELATAPHALGLSDVTSRLGRKMLTPRETVLPHLDESELNELGDNGGSYRGYLYALGGGVMLLLVGWFLRCGRRRAMAVAIPLGLLTWSGCGPAGNPSPHLAAAFTQTRVVYDANGGGLKMTLVVKNDGNQAIKLLNAGGGCTCRQVDQSRFPITLRPGTTLSIPVNLNDRRSPGPEEIIFTFETDRGLINTPTKLYALAAHQLNPETPTNNGVREQGDWGFDLVHRHVFAADAGAATTVMNFPAEFAAKKVGSHSGRVGGANEFAFVDTAYRVELVNKALGMHKSGIQLRSTDGRTLVDAPVLWRRLTFLNHTPELVMLSERPVRVFLRCDDEAVELTRVLSETPGVKAVLASPREVSISLSDAAPPVIDGHVTVATNAAGQPPLDIRVIRYSPAGPLTQK